MSRPRWRDRCVSGAGRVEALTIFRERGENTGEQNKANVRASVLCAGRWLEAGREVLFATPEHGDVNDILREAS